MKRFALAALALLAACATEPPPEPKIETVPVNKPVAMLCVPQNFPHGAPVFTDTPAALKAAVDAAERYRLTTIGRGERDAWIKQAVIVIDKCTEKPPLAPAP